MVTERVGRPRRGAAASSKRRALVAGQQLIDRHVVEPGQALEPGHRDGPLAPLVGPEHRRLELLVRGRLDLLERQALLAADGPQALADLPAVARSLSVRRPPVFRHSSRSPVCLADLGASRTCPARPRLLAPPYRRRSRCGNRSTTAISPQRDACTRPIGDAVQQHRPRRSPPSRPAARPVPSADRRQPDRRRSSSLHPPSGPTSTVGHAPGRGRAAPVGERAPGSGRPRRRTSRPARHLREAAPAALHRRLPGTRRRRSGWRADPVACPHARPSARRRTGRSRRRRAR